MDSTDHVQIDQSTARIINDEDRWLDVYRALGQTDAGRYLVVFFIFKLSEQDARPSAPARRFIGNPGQSLATGAIDFCSIVQALPPAASGCGFRGAEYDVDLGAMREAVIK